VTRLLDAYWKTRTMSSERAVMTKHRRYGNAPMSHVSLTEAVQAASGGHQVAAGRWGTK